MYEIELRKDVEYESLTTFSYFLLSVIVFNGVMVRLPFKLSLVITYLGELSIKGNDGDVE